MFCAVTSSALFLRIHLIPANRRRSCFRHNGEGYCRGAPRSERPPRGPPPTPVPKRPGWSTIGPRWETRCPGIERGRSAALGPTMSHKGAKRQNGKEIQTTKQLWSQSRSGKRFRGRGLRPHACTSLADAVGPARAGAAPRPRKTDVEHKSRHRETDPGTC